MDSAARVVLVEITAAMVQEPTAVRAETLVGVRADHKVADLAVTQAAAQLESYGEQADDSQTMQI